MIGLLIAAAATVSTPAAAATDAASVDPARLAAEQHLLEVVHADRQFKGILTQMLPIMTKQIFGNLQNDTRVPTSVRARLADPAMLTTAERTFATKVIAQFRSRFAALGAATAAEYARAFDVSELNALQAFYASPIGQRALVVMPALQQKLIPLGMKIGSDAGVAAMQETVETLGLDDQEKKS